MESPLANLRVNGDRLWQSLMDMARIGATDKGGVCRLALSDEDRRAREQFTTWCAQAGCSVRSDAIGNLFARRRGTREAARPVVMGSHLDSQPTGGKFDGVYGVLAGLEVIRTLQENNVKTRAPMEIAVWTNEEGARFAPAMLGSAVFAGNLPLQQALASQDADGRTVEQELRRLGYAGTTCPRQEHPAAYLELHIEQGPVLEREQLQIGIVTGVQGIRWYDVVVTGSEAHAGPTPMSMRKDSVQASIALLSMLYGLAQSFAPDARVTVGQLHASPGSRNTVAGRVQFSLDIRHPDEETLERMDHAVRSCLARAGSAPCSITMTAVWLSKPVSFAAHCTSAARAAAVALGYSHRDIVSGAGHDAVNLSRIVPTGMIFIPCLEGVSHNEQESVAPEEAKAGANVLLHAAMRLDEFDLC